MATEEDPQTEETKEMEMQPRRRRRRKLSWKPYKKEKGIKSKIKLEDKPLIRRWLEFPFLKGEGKARPLELALTGALVAFRGAQCLKLL